MRAVDSSPFTVGFVTIVRSASATTVSASSTGISASFSGFEASKIRLAVSPSEYGAVATATAAEVVAAVGVGCAAQRPRQREVTVDGSGCAPDEQRPGRPVRAGVLDAVVEQLDVGRPPPRPGLPTRAPGAGIAGAAGPAGSSSVRPRWSSGSMGTDLSLSGRPAAHGSPYCPTCPLICSRRMSA